MKRIRRHERGKIRQGSRRRSVLIVCEGERTEPAYFRSLRRLLGLSTVQAEVEGGEHGSAPISVVDQAIILRERRRREARRSPEFSEYNSVWCVIDVEAPQPHQSLAQALNKARDNGLKVALSNPCFEYWYLLHFEKTGAPMLSNDAVVHALKSHCSGYPKNDPDFVRHIYPETASAIRRAREVLRENHQDNEDLRDCNPSTHVFRLVEVLRGVGAMP